MGTPLSIMVILGLFPSSIIILSYPVILRSGAYSVIAGTNIYCSDGSD